MKFALSVAALAIALTPGLHSAPQAKPAPVHYFCYGERFPAYGTPESKEPHVVYIPPAFDAADNIGAVSSAFKRYLVQKYHLNASTSVSCAPFPTAAAAQDARKKKQQDVDDKQQKEVAETWTYAPEVAAAPPVRPAPPAAAPQRPAPAASNSATAKPPAAPAPAATPAPVALVDPRLAQIMEPYRTMIQKEATKDSQGYCEFNVRMFVGVDCGKFAKALLEYRIAHASEYHTPTAPKDDGGYRPIGALMAQSLIACPDCLDSAKVQTQVHELVLGQLQPQIMAKVITPAQGEAIAACAVGKYPETFKAHPYPNEVWRDLDDAKNACLH